MMPVDCGSAGLGHRLNAPVQGLDLMVPAGGSSFGSVRSYREIPCLGSHLTPEGWVQPQGVDPRVPDHTDVWTEERLAALRADPYLIQSFIVSETV